MQNCFQKNKAMGSEISCGKCKRKGHKPEDCFAGRTSEKVNFVGDENGKDEFSFFISTGFRAEENPVFIIDSGCSNYMIKDKHFFVDLDENDYGAYECANGTNSKIEGRGRAEFYATKRNGDSAKIILKDALYTPSNGQNLLSVAKLKEAGASFHFAERDEIITKDGIIFALEPRNNMFVWRTVTNPTIDMDSNHCNQEEQCFASSLKVWHERLGHTNYNDLKRLSEHVEGMKISNKDEGICGCCETNKSKRRPVPKDTITRATEVLETVHTDVLGPIANESPENFKYAIGFVDSFSRFIKVYFMRSRDEVLEKFQQFCSDIGNPRMVVSDGAKEFTSSEFRSLCRKRGIRHETSAPYTPEENGKIERVWGTVVGMTRCMLDKARLGKRYWPYALNYAF